MLNIIKFSWRGSFGIHCMFLFGLLIVLTLEGSDSSFLLPTESTSTRRMLGHPIIRHNGFHDNNKIRHNFHVDRAFRDKKASS